MKKFIVTTTIQPPTLASVRFSEMKDWTFIIVGDQKTPHKEYDGGNWIYLHPDYQQKTYPELSDAIGWHCIMRRNIGFVEAWRMGADVVASIDDDNIPYSDWGKNLWVGKSIDARVYDVPEPCLAFDPLSVTNHPEVWHRGYPVDTIHYSRTPVFQGIKKQKVLIQADLWDGDPDVDAICRMIYQPTFAQLIAPYGYTSDKYIPFNSQNTFFAREVLPYYMVLPHVGRMDDIWGGYIAQYLLNTRPVFFPPTTYQQRNAQSIRKNLQDEVFGYLNTTIFLENLNNFELLLPDNARAAYNIYRKTYENLIY
jgi:hypothetical protein